MKALLASIVLFAGLLVAPLSHAGEPRTALVMFEQQNCEWCAAWFSEIGPIYPLTAEGKRAPIRRVDIHDPMPDDLAHIEGSRFTPTFVLIHDGQEVGRIRGYPGEDFFWGLLDQLMQRLPPQS